MTASGSLSSHRPSDSAAHILRCVFWPHTLLGCMYRPVLWKGCVMRIAQVVPLHVAVPPAGYGGTERVAFNFSQALVKLGDDVTVFASRDSHTNGRPGPGVGQAIQFRTDNSA